MGANDIITYEDYLSELSQKLNFLERLTDEVTGSDDRLDLLAKILLTQNKLLMTALLQPPLLTERADPTIKEFPLDEATVDKEVGISGNFLAMTTDGIQSGISVKFDRPNNDPFYLSESNHWNCRFDNIFLSWTEQPGKKLKAIVGLRSSASVYLPIKGEYAGTPKSIATDDYGRLLAVISDPEDIWGNPHLIGNAELAARLGSIVTYDRRGDVVWFDDFQSGLAAWTKTKGGTGADAYITADNAKRGAFCCKMISGKDEGRYMSITHYGGGLVFSKLGVEISFTLNLFITELRVPFIYYDGTNWYDTDIRLYPMDRELKYKGSDALYHSFATLIKLDTTQYVFHTLKYVIDLPNGKYNRVLLDNIVYDLSDIALKKRTSTEYPIYSFNIMAKTAEDVTKISYVADAILTQNES